MSPAAAIGRCWGPFFHHWGKWEEPYKGLSQPSWVQVRTCRKCGRTQGRFVRA